MTSWTGLQRREGCGFLRWLKKETALERGFDDLAGALRLLLDDWVRSEQDVREVWAATSAVVAQCNEEDTYCMPGAARAYAWLHLLDRYVRTWFALQRLVEQRILPMGKEGVHALDVGTGPGPSAFAVHDFFAAMVRYSEGPGSRRWRQPTRIACVEFADRMNHFRHNLAERLYVGGAPKAVLQVCGHIRDFRSVSPARERRKENERLRNAEDHYWDEDSGESESESLYSPEEANWMANDLHRYRLFMFSNFLTNPCTVERFRRNLTDLLSDAHPGSVLLLVGGKGHDYPEVYGEVAGLARDAGFSREAECGEVSCSGAGMHRRVHAEQVGFYRRLRDIVGDLHAADSVATELTREFEGELPGKSPKSAVRAWRK